MTPSAKDRVDYGSIDPFKVEAQRIASTTDENIARLGFRVRRGTRGESLFVIETTSGARVQLLGGVIETLGTKNLVADSIRTADRTFYDNVAQDTVAMIVNDVATLGFIPVVVGQLLLTGGSEWFQDTQRALDLITGWASACNVARCVYGPGETAALSGLVTDDSVALSGFALSLPTEAQVEPMRLRAGDAIILIESAGIHANGLTNARALAEKLPDGFATRLPSGRSYGEALLDPTHIYSSVVEDVIQRGVALHYAVHITGHGWRKLMRSSEEFCYEIDELPDAPEVLSFLVQQSGMDEPTAYGTFNMGAGFALFVAESDIDTVIKVASSHNFRAWRGGTVREGSRQVSLKQLGIVFSDDSLQLR